MFIQLEFITGFNVGIEFIEEDNSLYVLIDLGILRILVEKFKKTS